MLAGKSNCQNGLTKMKNKEMSKEKLGQLVMQGLQGRGIKEGMGSHSRKDRGLEGKKVEIVCGRVYDPPSIICGLCINIAGVT